MKNKEEDLKEYKIGDLINIKAKIIGKYNFNDVDPNRRVMYEIEPQVFHAYGTKYRVFPDEIETPEPQ